MNKVAKQGTAFHYRDFRLLWTATMFSSASAWAKSISMYYNIKIAGNYNFNQLKLVRIQIHNIFLGILVTTNVSDGVKILFLAILAFINGSARAAQTSASESLLPNLIPKELLLNGIAWNQAALHGSRLFGPAAIAPLLSLFNLEWAFYLCSAFYVISLIASLLISTVFRIFITCIIRKKF